MILLPQPESSLSLYSERVHNATFFLAVLVLLNCLSDWPSFSDFSCLLFCQLLLKTNFNKFDRDQFWGPQKPDNISFFLLHLIYIYYSHLLLCLLYSLFCDPWPFTCTIFSTQIIKCQGFCENRLPQVH